MTTAPASRSGRIVAGVDGSPSSLDALAWAAQQAERTGAALEVLSTWEWPSSLGWAVPVPDDFDPEGEVRQALEAATGPVRAAHPDVQINTRVVNGHPAPSLVEASKGADLLVVGSRGHGEFLGMVIGSVSEFCASHAHCPVLVHRATA
jgi:nucleotide-binding universal stress UspA family protein